jgi:hypothetical protein
MSEALRPAVRGQGGRLPPSCLRQFTPREYLENSETGKALRSASSLFFKYSRGSEPREGRGAGAGSPPCAAASGRGGRA